MDATLICPNCKNKIPLDEALNARAEQVVSARIASDREQLLKQLQAEFAEKTAFAVKKAGQEARTEVARQQALELKDLQARLKEKETQLSRAQDEELALRKKSRLLEEQQAQWEVEKARQLDSEREKIRRLEQEALQESLKRNEDEHRRREKEQATQIEIMQKTIEDLRRQAQQGSQQVQGEAQESDLKSLLSAHFPEDVISDVPAGAFGADLVQKVGVRLGRKLGTIVWESKNAKAFKEEWLSKLKKDQGLVRAEVAILVSTILPNNLTRFGQRQGIWICRPADALALATVLRTHLSELERVKISLEGQDQKMTALYQYLSGPLFQNRIEQLVLAFMGFKQDLESEKRTLTARWSKREKQIEQMMLTTAGFYGDMQGIIGGALPKIAQLDLESTESEVELTASPAQLSLLTDAETGAH